MQEGTTKGRILVVDDDYLICKLLTNRLSHEGYECQSCKGTEEALSLMERQVFDLVILDLIMPGGMTGLELLMAAHTQYLRTAFLIATGVHDANVEAAAKRLGAADYLVKPFDLDAVVRRVKRALDIQRQV